MMLKTVFTLFVISQVVALLAAGIAILWFSQDLMTWLIHRVGGERALGANNVVRLENGVLLTNPDAMILWSMPIWLLGWLQITAAISLIGLRFVRPRPRGR